jgi:predicted transcriptional regulator
MKQEKIKQILKATKTEDLNSVKCEMDYLYRLEVKKRNQTKIRKFKVGEDVVFNTPTTPSTNHLPLVLQGTILKLGKTKMKILTAQHGALAVPAIRVGRHNAHNDMLVKHSNKEL